MKKYPNPSRYFYIDISILLCLIYFINSAFISIEVLKEIDIIEEVKISVSENSNQYWNIISELNFKTFLIDVVWYLLFYFLLEITSKALSVLELIANILGNPIKINIKLLNKYCTLLLLILGGKFLVFIITSIV
jgi:hypothetical protein